MSTVSLLCRYLLEKLRQSSTHTIFKDTMHDANTKKDITLGRIMYGMKMHYTQSRSVDMKDTLHSDVQCEI